MTNEIVFSVTKTFYIGDATSTTTLERRYIYQGSDFYGNEQHIEKEMLASLESGKGDKGVEMNTESTSIEEEQF